MKKPNKRPPLLDLPVLLLGCSPVPLIEIEKVSHVGTFDLKHKTVHASLEAFCLSVSLHPEDWKSIARIGGVPTWDLARDDSKWLDVSSLSDAQTAAIEKWGVDAGCAKPAMIYLAHYLDSETESPLFFQMDSLEAAEYEIEDLENGYVTCVEGLKLTDQGMQALERWQDCKNATDGLYILWADQVLSRAHQSVVGLWWDETYAPLALSCPRGGILPSKIDEFERTLQDPVFEADMMP